MLLFFLACAPVPEACITEIIPSVDLQVLDGDEQPLPAEVTATGPRGDLVVECADDACTRFLIGEDDAGAIDIHVSAGGCETSTRVEVAADDCDHVTTEPVKVMLDCG